MRDWGSRLSAAAGGQLGGFRRGAPRSLRDHRAGARGAGEAWAAEASGCAGGRRPVLHSVTGQRPGARPDGSGFIRGCGNLVSITRGNTGCGWIDQLAKKMDKTSFHLAFFPNRS